MCAVWVCVPSARPVPEVAAWAKKWQAQGYKVALWRDRMETSLRADYIYCGAYPGYAVAANHLTSEMFYLDPSCDWVVATGDDTDPDMAHTADEIAAQCSEHFKDLAWPMHWHWDAKYRSPEEALAAGARAEQKKQALWSTDVAKMYSTFGVCQPTGDRFSEGSIDRICGSPWLGRSFCERINQGRGPFWPEYTHCFGDEELWNVATKLGILWQRRDLTHYHHHFTRVPGKDIGQVTAPPPHLVEATSAAHWVKYKALFAKRKAAGFPGSEPIA